MMNDREVAEDLLHAVTCAIKVAEKMLESEDENTLIFAIDATAKLVEMAITLMTVLEEAEVAEEENPLARRARLGR